MKHMLYLIVPAQWTEWTAWTTCNKSCGGGEKGRERQCNPGVTNISLSTFVEIDYSECEGDQAQIRPCNVLPCPVRYKFIITKPQDHRHCFLINYSLS